jgi:hypothetical protein
MFQIHLKGEGYSGRGVRYRILSPSELDRNEITAAKTLDDGFTRAEYQVEVQRLGVVQMIVSYTDGSVQDPQTAKWTPANSALLDTQWDSIFCTKDSGVLRAIFQREHGVSKEEVDAILKGKAEVLAD